MATDANGFVLTGEVAATGAPMPHALETSVPGVFAVGDVRAGSVKRAGGAIGEGAAVVVQIHQHLDALKRRLEAVDPGKREARAASPSATFGRFGSAAQRTWRSSRVTLFPVDLREKVWSATDVLSAVHDAQRSGTPDENLWAADAAHECWALLHPYTGP